jgi:hypothetical protein
MAAFASLLAALGTAPDMIWLLTGPALVVAPVTGTWKGPYLLAVASAPRSDSTRPPAS